MPVDSFLAGFISLFELNVFNSEWMKLNQQQPRNETGISSSHVCCMLNLIYLLVAVQFKPIHCAKTLLAWNWTQQINKWHAIKLILQFGLKKSFHPIHSAFINQPNFINQLNFFNWIEFSLLLINWIKLNWMDWNDWFTLSQKM